MKRRSGRNEELIIHKFRRCNYGDGIADNSKSDLAAAIKYLQNLDLESQKLTRISMRIELTPRPISEVQEIKRKAAKEQDQEAEQESSKSNIYDSFKWGGYDKLIKFLHDNMKKGFINMGYTDGFINETLSLLAESFGRQSITSYFNWDVDNELSYRTVDIYMLNKLLKHFQVPYLIDESRPALDKVYSVNKTDSNQEG